MKSRLPKLDTLASAIVYKDTFDFMVDWLLRNGNANVIERIYGEAQQKFEASVPNSLEERKLFGVIQVMARSSWDRAIAIGRLDERVELEVKGLAQLHFDKTPDEVADLVATLSHPGGNDVRRRIIAGLRGMGRGPAGSSTRP